MSFVFSSGLLFLWQNVYQTLGTSYSNVQLDQVLLKANLRGEKWFEHSVWFTAFNSANRSMFQHNCDECSQRQNDFRPNSNSTIVSKQLLNVKISFFLFEFCKLSLSHTDKHSIFQCDNPIMTVSSSLVFIQTKQSVMTVFESSAAGWTEWTLTAPRLEFIYISKQNQKAQRKPTREKNPIKEKKAEVQVETHTLTLCLSKLKCENNAGIVLSECQRSDIVDMVDGTEV